jgi:outer membrane protein OmpA-like peptidoglycan-associated protein
MLSEDYHWKRPGHRQRRPDSRLSHWVMTALILSVAAHGVLWVIFGTFEMRPIAKLTLTEPFSIKRSTFDATVLDDLADPGIPETTAADPTRGEANDASMAEELARMTEFSEDDLPVDFLVNAEIKLTPAVEEVENVALEPVGSSVDDEALAGNDIPLRGPALTEAGMEPQPSPLDPDHPTLATGDLLGEVDENPADPSAQGGGSGDGDLIPAGYASLDEVLGMKGQGDPGKPIWVPTDVLFEFNSAELREDARLSLMKLGALIMQRKDSEFVLEGHTDLIGEETYNLALSVNRATAIRNWLLDALRLDPRRILVKGHGKTKPIVLEGTAEEQAPNRRVEVTIQPIGTSSPLNAR